MSLSEAGLRATRKYHASHREARRLYAAGYRKRNPEYRQSKRTRLDALKAAPCLDCGGSFPPECMDFDHARGEKSFEIGPAYGKKLEALLEEIAKCDLVCSNCHRIRTKRRKISKR